MKIKINNYKSYEISLPDEITSNQFFEVIGRLNNRRK